MIVMLLFCLQDCLHMWAGTGGVGLPTCHGQGESRLSSDGGESSIAWALFVATLACITRVSSQRATQGRSCVWIPMLPKALSVPVSPWAALSVGPSCLRKLDVPGRWRLAMASIWPAFLVIMLMFAVAPMPRCHLVAFNHAIQSLPSRKVF